MQLGFNLRKELVKCYSWNIALYGAENWTLWKYIRINWKSLKCGAGEGWRSVSPIMRKMSKYYKDSRRRISYKQ